MLDHKKVSIFIIWVPCAIRAEPKTPPSAGLAAARVARTNQPGRFWWVNGELHGVSRVASFILFHIDQYWSNWILVGGIRTHLKNLTSSVGMMKFPIYGKINMFQTTNQELVDSIMNNSMSGRKNTWNSIKNWPNRSAWMYIYIYIYTYCIASCTFPPSSRH